MAKPISILNDERNILRIVIDGEPCISIANENVDSIIPYAENNKSIWFAIIKCGIIEYRVNGTTVKKVKYEEIK